MNRQHKKVTRQKVYSVTKDNSASLPKLKRLENSGLIKIFQVDLENLTKKIKETCLPSTIFPFKLNHSRFMDKNSNKRWKKILKVIGKSNLNDAKIVETHLREGHDFLVTEDHHILDKKKELRKVFPSIRIMSPDELVNKLGMDNE